MAPKADKKKKNRLQGGGGPQRKSLPPSGGSGAAPCDGERAPPPQAGWGEGRPVCDEEQEEALTKLTYIRGAEALGEKQLPPTVILVEDFISPEVEQELLEFFDAQQWDSALPRRTQQWGWTFDYEEMTVTGRGRPLPEVLTGLLERFRGIAHDHQFPAIPTPDQMIVNEYTPGQGIHPHIDRDCFSEVIVSLGLGSHCTMVFDKPQPESTGGRVSDLSAMPTWLQQHIQVTATEIPVFFPRRALIAFTSEARWGWTHCIPPRTWDEEPKRGRRVQRDRRVSLTFRRMSDKFLQRQGAAPPEPPPQPSGVTIRGGKVVGR
eukprot:TRINITY_DN60222_c0_g1_i1.p1 TRINITY_DN60222_c0_g1~~TRINITY_DN60222_c0_g1_i1.p1  ORF type:complete len:345 (+),score=80.28 TRINITY_DN60222_c0_g1_i1:76-1035(+)